MRLIGCFLILVGPIFGLQGNNCGCSPAPKDQKTIKGKEWVIINQGDSVEYLRGRILAGSLQDPVEGVLVEVFDRPDILLLNSKGNQAFGQKQRRISACITGKDGKFCFDKLPKGKYELRCSKAVEWDPTSVVINVGSRKKGESAGFIAWMSLSH